MTENSSRATEPSTRAPRVPALVETVYGCDPVSFSDPAELYHEASSFYASFHARQTPGTSTGVVDAMHDVLGSSEGKRYVEAERIHLPVPALPAKPFADVLQARTSSREFSDLPLACDCLASVLHAGYGVVDRTRGLGLPVRRVTPSGGGLYPLELYVYTRSVATLPVALFHFDAFSHRLERTATHVSEEQLAVAFPNADVVRGAAAMVLITSVAWRSRFKYGLRSYRFSLLEAGHVAQNILLAAAASELAACPLGGFYDRQLNDVLGLDSVNDFALYAVALGHVAI